MKLKLFFSFFILFIFNYSFGQLSSQQAVVGVETSATSNYESPEKWLQESFGTFDQTQEEKSLRDQNAKHFKNADGSYTAVIAAGNMHYWENERWNTIFHGIEPSINGFRNITNSHKTFYPGIASNSLITVLPNGNQIKDMVDMRMYFEVNGQVTNSQEISGAAGAAVFNKLTYSNVYGPGIDLQFTQETTKRKMDYIIANINALGSIPNQATYLVFEEKVELPAGWFAVLNENVIYVMDNFNAVKAIYEKPLFSDTPHLDGDGHSHNDEAEGTYALSQMGNILTIQTKVQLDWLTNTDRVFPVVIDPTVNLYPDNTSLWTGHIHTNSAAPTPYTSTTIISGVDNNMKIGKGTYGSENNNCYHAWAKFNISSIPSTCVNSVNLSVTPNDVDGVIGSGCFINVSLRPLVNDPVPATNANRLTDIRDGTAYSNIVFTTANESGLQTFGLGASAVTDLTASIAAGWFGVGFNTTAVQSPHYDYLSIQPHSNANRPYLTVDYTPNYRVSFSSPTPVILCAGQTQNVSVTVTNTGCLPWTSGGVSPNSVNFSWWGSWQAGGLAAGQDNNPRVQPFLALAPGASQVVSFSVTAPPTAGTYSIQTDLVRDGVCWFRNNGAPGCGPGNVDFVFPITVKQVTPPTSISGAMTICNGTPIALTSVGGEVVHYPFTTNLNDISGNALNLSGAGGTISAAGLSLTIGSSYTSAVSQVLNIDKYTIAFEMRYDAAPDGSWRKIFGFEPVGTDRSPGIWKYPSSMQLHWRHDPGNTGISEALTYTQGQFYQVVGVKNGANFYIYVDGNLVDQGTVANPKTPGAASLFFGGAPVTLRNFKIFNGALSWYSGSCGGTLVNYGPTAIVSPAVTTTYFLRTEGDCANTACVSATVTVNQPANPPTSISATNPLHPAYCHGNTVNLTSVGGTAAGGGIVDVWYEHSCNTVVEETWSTSPLSNPGWWIGSTTINSANGILNVTSTGTDPMIYLGNLSINPDVYRYVQVRYRYVSGPATPGMQVFFENGSGLAESKSQRGTMIMDGSWHYLNLDMSLNYSNVNSGWIGGGTVTGLRFDFCENTGMVMEFDFFLVSESRMIGDQANLVLNPGDTYYPTTSSQYFTRKIDNCGATSCASTNVNLPPLGTNLSLDGENETCLVNQMGWVHFYHTSGRLIASVNSGGQNLGNVTITSYVEGAPASVPACDFPLNTDYTTAYMQRHWVVTPQFQPATPVQVKLPFNNVEFTNLVGVANTNPNGNDNLLVPNDLKLTKYSGPLNVNDDAVDNCPSNGGSGGATIHTQTGTDVTTLYSLVTGAQYAEYPVPSFSELWLHGSLLNSPLPVELVSLAAVCEENGNDVKVRWTTVSEQNSSHFTVERSVDGINWIILGTVNAAGTSTSNLNYEMIDSDTRGYSVIYYRLNQFDNNGVSKAYGLISAECLNEQLDFEVFPNPAGNEVTVLLHGDHQEGETSIHITDINGKEVKTIFYSEQVGKLISVDLRNLEQGIYFVRLVNGEENNQFVRLIKQ
jgi:hypothetical protein